MQSEKAVGYAVFALGIAILLITLYIGYGLYQFISVQSKQPQQVVAAPQNSTAQNISSAISGAIGQSLPPKSDFLYIIEIIFLFLFANIGYKIAILGVHMNSSKKSGTADYTRDKNAKKQ
ncbi:MAG: hypothetical protein QW814_03605 [Methanothrix sp.]